MPKKIIGLGNALADILVETENDSILRDLGFGRGSMNLVDRAIHERIQRLTDGKEVAVVSGGSAANTVRGLARLIPDCRYIGKIGRDNLGRYMEEEMWRLSVDTRFIHSATPTGRCMVLISPDGERTMATFLGAAVELVPEEIRVEMFRGYDILHIEGYLVQDHALIEHAVRKARKEGLAISLDMASYNVVEENLEFLKRLFEESVDILFANEQESLAFTGLPPEEAARKLARDCSVAVVKTGAEGSLVACGDDLVKVEAVPVSPVDTTGAGDLYASGFLYGLSRELPLGVCGQIGSLIASYVITVTGPAIPEESWPEIRRKIGELSGM